MRQYPIACALMLLSAISVHAQGKGKDTGRVAGWLADYGTARAEARKTGKPIMAVIRCEPCPEARQFDDQVRQLDKQIAGVADQFVRVRLTRITGIDLRIFEFDYDVTWFALFMNADDTVYGRYGGRDAGKPDARMSLPGLRVAMEHAIDLHKNPPKPVMRMGQPVMAESLSRGKAKGNCMHCHNVNEGVRTQLKSQGKWERDLAWTYPLPENVGITLDVDRGNLIKSVAENSPAAKAGLKGSDTLKSLNDLPVGSSADVSYALNKGPKSGEIAVTYSRDNKPLSGKLTVADGWKKTNLSWRPSMINLLPGNFFSGDELKPDEKKTLGLANDRLAFRQDKFVHSSLKVSGVLKDDVLIGIGGKDLNGNLDAFTDYIHTNHLAGDEVTLRLMRDGKLIELKTTLK